MTELASQDEGSYLFFARYTLCILQQNVIQEMRRNILAAWAAYTAWDDVVVGHDGYAT